MRDRFADEVVVPDVVGMPFHIAREVAAEAGVALANPDPDGPPIDALAWPGLFYVTAQRPAPGTVLRRWESVTVDIVEHGVEGDRAPRGDSDPPLPLAAHAEPDTTSHVDLADRNGRAARGVS